MSGSIGRRWIHRSFRSTVGSFVDDVNASHWAIEYDTIFNDARGPRKPGCLALEGTSSPPFHCQAPLLCVAGCKFVAAGCYRRLGSGLWLVRVFRASLGEELLMWHGTVHCCWDVFVHDVEMNDFRLKQKDESRPWHQDEQVPFLLHPKPSLQLGAMHGAKFQKHVPF